MTRIPGVVSAKTILHWQGVLPNNTVRLPLVGPTPGEVEQLRADLAEAGLEYNV
jgi:4-hydroxy-tetrahydrodipicolinate synthase